MVNKFTFNHLFCRAVKYFEKVYNMGDAILIPNIERPVTYKSQVALIHALYENGDDTSNYTKYRAVIEIFTYPKELGNIKEYKIFHKDFEVCYF